jgi:hypothetical protein
LNERILWAFSNIVDNKPIADELIKKGTIQSFVSIVFATMQANYGLILNEAFFCLVNLITECSPGSIEDYVYDRDLQN